MKIFLHFCFTLLSFLFSSFAYSDTLSHYVLVTVAPHKFFVEQIAGDTIEIGLLVPAGASSHTFEPTPRQMLQASKADLWFGIGEMFETRTLRALQSYHTCLKLVDLRQNIPLITTHDHAAHSCSHPNCADLHIWLSPKLAKFQAQTIAKALIETYPEHAEEYKRRAAIFLDQLDLLDKDIEATLKPLKNRIFLVSHPSYTYFAKDYNLEQLSIEFEGKDPTPRQLTGIIHQARLSKIKTIFIQSQYSNKGAKLIAQEIGAKVVNLDPYSENYLDSMRNIARSIADQENS